MNLTERFIQSLEIPEKCASFADGRGLELRVSPNAKMSWSLLFRFDGKKTRYTIGDYPAVKLKDARVLADKLRNQVVYGHNPQAAKQTARRQDAITVADCYAQFLERYLKIQVKTWPEYDRRIRADVLPAIGRKHIDRLEKSHIIKIIDRLMDRGAPVLANRVLQYISKFLNWCVGRGYIEANPAALIPKPAKERSRERVLTLDEVRAIYRASDSLGGVQGAFVKLLLLTDQRRSEISKLQWSGLQNDRIEIGATRSKNGKAITTPLTAHVLNIVKSLYRNNGSYVFSTDGGHSSIGNFSAIKSKLQKASGTDHWTFHDFRRSLATHLEIAGCSRQDIQWALNHVDNTVTGVYDRSDHYLGKLKCLELWAKIVTKGINLTHQCQLPSILPPDPGRK